MVCAAIGLAARPAMAQRAFESITAGIGVMHNFGAGSLEEFWEPPVASDLRVSFPFYAGSIHFSLGSGTYSAHGNHQPDFESHLLTAGWSAGRPLVLGADGRAGLQVGAMTMDFDDERTPVGNLEETELLLGAEIALSRRLAGGLGVEVYVATQRVFTRRPIDLFNAGVAANYTLGLPTWLSGALR